MHVLLTICVAKSDKLLFFYTEMVLDVIIVGGTTTTTLSMMIFLDCSRVIGLYCCAEVSRTDVEYV
jgi:hypothetical protein